jgi:stress response protein YsnF
MSDKTRHIEEAVIPLAEESVSVSKREVETGQVRVALSTDIETVIAREMLRGCRIEVDRVSVNRALPDGEPAPQSRQEGDMLVIPIVEEKAVVVKRLVVTEEVRLRFVTTETPFEKEVSVRRQRATVDRVTPDASNTDPAMIRRDAS